MHVDLLGHVTANHDGTPVLLGAPRQRAVLAILALSPGRVVPRDSLVDGIWGEDLPGRPEASIQVYVHGLRKALEEAGAERSLLASQAPGYRLLLDPSDTDLGQFETLWRQARSQAEQGDQSSARDALVRGLGLWRGMALADLRGMAFAQAPAARLDEMRLAATEDLVDLRLACGEHVELATELEELTAIHPTRERLWGQLMIALYRCDRQVDALATYARARDRLADELGLDPGEALQHLEAGILRHDPQLAAPVPMSAAATDHPATTVPTQSRVAVRPRREGRIPHVPTPLIGRSELVDSIVRRLRRGTVRAVTLVGPGGTGKTRVAWAVATALGDAGRTSLAVVAEPGQLAVDLLSETALAAGGRAPSDNSMSAAASAVADAVGQQAALVVLDGVEEVPDLSAAIELLLELAPSITVLATSRLPLRVDGSLELPVPPLPIPESDWAPGADPLENPALALLADRAERATLGFTLDGTTTQAALELVRALDGVPLAIELAAAWLRTMRIEDVVDRVRRSVRPGGRNDGPDSLVATIAWSVDHLPPSAHSLLHSIALMPGDIGIRALDLLGEVRRQDPETARWPDPVDDLAALVDAGLVRMTTTRVQLRYRLLGPLAAHVRASAEAQTHFQAQRDRWRERLAVDLAASAAEWSDELSTPGGDLALGRFADERPDIDGLIDWSVATGRAPLAAALVHASHRLHIASGRAGELLSLAARVPTGAISSTQAPDLAVAMARAAYHVGRHDQAETLSRSALNLPGVVPATEATAECYLAAALVAQGKVADAETHAQRAHAAATEAGVYDTAAVALSVLAIVAAVRGEFALEQRRYEERLALARARGDRSRVGDTLNTLAEIALDEPDLPAAREHSDEALRLAGTDRPIERRDALITGARVSVLDGDNQRAAEELYAALALARSLGHPLGVAQCARVAAHLSLRAGDPERSVRLFAAAQSLSPSPDGGDEPMEGDLRAAQREARAAVGPDRAERLWAFGGHESSLGDTAAAVTAALAPYRLGG